MSVHHPVSSSVMSSTPSKKRKLESNGQESSKKKRKQPQTQEANDTAQSTDGGSQAFERERKSAVASPESTPQRKSKPVSRPDDGTPEFEGLLPKDDDAADNVRKSKTKDNILKGAPHSARRLEPTSAIDGDSEKGEEDTYRNQIQSKEGKRRKVQGTQNADHNSDSIQEPTFDTHEEEIPPEDTIVEPTDHLEMQDWTYMDSEMLDSEALSCFYTKRVSLLVPIPAISFTTVTASSLSAHLAPALLTYFPPAEGIVLAFSDPVLSAKAASAPNMPLLPPIDDSTKSVETDIPARAGDEFAVLWAWLTATFFVFSPQRGDELIGWSNVSSEGFVGLVSYNYFQTAVGKSRIPNGWKWNGATAHASRKKGRKGKLGESHSSPVPHQDSTQETTTTTSGDLDGDVGYFTSAGGGKVEDTMKYKILDTQMIPAHDREKWSLHIDGTLLDEAEEKKVVEEERIAFEGSQRPMSRAHTPSGNAAEPLKSGSLQR